MSLFSRALAGAADAGSKLINRYIDEDLLRSRAQVLADIQRTNAVQTDKDLSAARLDPARVAAERGIKVDDIKAVGAAQYETALAGKRAEATDETLLTANLDRDRRISTQSHDIKVEQAIADSGNPSLLKATADLENASPSKKAETRLKNAQADEALAKAGYLKAGGGKSGSGNKAEKMDEADKIEYQNLFGEVKSALGNQAKFETDGMPLDGEGKSTAQYGLVKKNVAVAQRKLLSFQMRKGLLDPADMASSTIAGEQDSAKIGSAIAQAYELGGAAFGDEFFAAVRKSGALERNYESQAAKPGASTGPRDTNTVMGKSTVALPGIPGRANLMERAAQLAAERRTAKPAPQDRSGDALRQEAASLTIEDIRGMAPDEAQRAYSRFQGVLGGDLLTELRRRM